jgi:hypothetical protein
LCCLHRYYYVTRDWCGGGAAAKYPEMTFASYATEAETDLAGAFGIRSIPGLPTDQKLRVNT